MNVLSSANNPNNYASQQREKRLEQIPRLGLMAVDTYMSGMRAFAPLQGAANSVATVGTVGLAVFHGGAAIYNLVRASEDDYNGLTSDALRRRAAAIGDAVTAIGYVGLAAGMGPWALPLLALGLGTVAYANFA